MTTAISSVVGNDPVILSGTAFLVYFTKIAEVSPVGWLFSEFVACNTASMVLFVGTNVVVCQGFSIKPLIFTAYTIFPFLACSVTGLTALYIQFWKTHIPLTVKSPQLDPKSVLLDPVGAIVGSIALLMTLILITGISFAGILFST
jgi:Na+/H+ antiporter NhaD/arsenite permease-like protein